MKFSDLSNTVIGCAIRVHRRLGPGLLESTYSICLAHELRKAGLRVSSDVALPLIYDDLVVEGAYRIDHLVEDSLVLELKAVDRIHAIHRAQTLTYMRLSGRREGLLINFNVGRLVDGVNSFAISEADDDGR